MARKISSLKKPSDDEPKTEEYDNSVMDIKNEIVSYNNYYINTLRLYDLAIDQL